MKKEIDVEKELLNYYTKEELAQMKEDYYPTHTGLHHLFEAMIEWAKPHDPSVRQMCVDESIIREQLSEGKSRREMLCKDCKEPIIFETKG